MQVQLSVANGTLTLPGNDIRQLSDQTPTVAWNGYYLKNNLGESNQPLEKGGVTYASGILTHPGSTPNQISTVSYAINGATAFTATLGIDESTWAPSQNYGNGVAYYVYLDDVLAYSSGPVTANSAPIALNVDTTGKSKLTLGVSPLSGFEYDHAAWFDAKLTGGNGLTLVSGANGSASMTWQGSAAAINNALAGLRYTPTTNFSGTDTLNVVTSDLGNTGAGGALTDARSVLINVNAVDSPPTVNVPGTFRVIEDRMSPLLFAGTPFADPDSTLLTVTLAVADGTLVGSSGNGITLGGTATARTFTGTVANLNAYFTRPGSLAYTTALNNTSPRTLTTTASDGNRSIQSTSQILIDPEPAPPPRPSTPAPPPFSWAPPAPQPTGLMTFERSVGPTSPDPARPTETFEPDVLRSLEVSGGVLAGPTAAAVAVPGQPRDVANHRMLVGEVAGVPQARQMTLDVSTRNTTSLGFDWSSAKPDQKIELYSGNRLIGRYGAAEVFADAPEGRSGSAYVTFRSLDGVAITRAQLSSTSSAFEVDNVTTDATDASRAATAASGSPAAGSGTLQVRMGLYGRRGAPAQPVVRSAGAASAAAAVPAGPSGPIVVSPGVASRAMGLYGVPAASSKEPVVLSELEIQSRARQMSAYALLAPASLADKEALERAYALRL
jgi:hypothetical protein